MNEIRLLELNLRNFKGIKSLELKPDGKNLFVYGENATGKTTIMDAFIWLLFDKDSANSSNFSIKTLDEQGNPIHGLEHEVIGILNIDGKVIELQKIYKEKWTKKKGQANSELTGHNTEYFINGVPKKKIEYNDYLSKIIDEDTFKIVTNPLYFNKNIDWKKRRNIALEICGEIAVDEIITANEGLKELKPLLEDKSIDDLKAEMKSRRSKLNEELKSIPYRIDEISRTDEVIDPIPLIREKAALEEKLSDIKNAKNIELEPKLKNIKNSISFLETESKRLLQEQSQELRDKLNGLYEIRSKVDRELFELLPKLNKTYSQMETLEDKKTRITENMDELRESFKEISSTVFDEGSSICPTCKQSLPVENIEALRGFFEEDKAYKLNNINQKGRELKETVAGIDKTLEELQAQKQTLDTNHKVVSEELNSIDCEISKVQEQLNNIDITQNKEWKKVQTEITKLNKEQSELIDLMKEQDNSAQITTLQIQIDGINTKLAKLDLIKDNEQRIQELKVREKELAEMVVETEKIEFLCNQYTITRANLLEDKLSGKFKLVRFKLFDLQVNGGTSDTFVATVDGVPFEDLNNAMKINAGLDIINTLADYYNFKAPIFIDNRESVNQIIDVNSQVINLIVSKDEKLIVEVED